MSSPPYLASTYLRVLQSDAQLMSVLNTIFGARVETLMQSEFVTLNDITAVFELCAEHGLDSWILRYAKHISVGSHGPLGFAVLSAPNLGVALQVLADFAITRTSTYRSELRENDRRAAFVAIDQTGNGLVGRWLIEVCFSVAQQLTEAIMGHPLGNNASISFTYPKPDYADELEEFYGIRCEFNADYNALSIPASWAQITSPLSDPDTFRTNLAKCQELKFRLDGTPKIDQSIRLQLNQHFSQRLSGPNNSAELPNLCQLADQHCMSKRTLARKLEQNQQSYKKIVSEVRRQHAVDLLQNSHLTISEIATILNYQEPANFIRAFKSWFGISPTHWRRTQSKSADTPRLSAKPAQA